MSPARFLCPLLTFMLIYHTIGYLHSSRHQTYVSLRKLMAVGTVSSDLTLPGENESTDLAFFYLKEELKLEDSTMMKIIRSHSWILYLRVESNLKPTVSVLQKAGFSPLEIRCLVDRIPSVLALDAVWSLPEKLHALQKMFFLTPASKLPRGKSATATTFTDVTACPGPASDSDPDSAAILGKLLIGSELRHLVLAQPYLLTSSISRNMEVADFLWDEMGLSHAQIRLFVLSNPQVVMTNLQTLSSCWSLLLTVWSLSGEAARSAVLRHPALLSSRALDDIQARRKLLRRLGIAPGTDRCRRVIERFPQILYISVGFFLEANVEILSDYLGVGDLTEPISVFPQLMGLNPASLERSCNFVLHMLTGSTEYYSLDIAGEADGMSEIDSKVSTDTEFSRRIGEEDPLRSLEIDVITDIVMRSRLLHEQSIRVQDALINLRIGRNNSSDSSDSKSISTSTRVLRKFGKNMGVRTRSRTRLLGRIARSTRTRAALPRPGRDDKLGKRAGLSITEQFFEKQSFPLLLTQERALKIVRAVPWLLSYRPERSRRVLLVLVKSLALTRSELTRCVALYPRLFSLSVNGKISEVLRTLAVAAADYISLQDAASTSAILKRLDGDETVGSISLGVTEDSDSEFESEIHLAASVGMLGDSTMRDLRALRYDPVRSMVRQVVLKFPLVLGTSIDKIETRLRDMKDVSMHHAKVSVMGPSIDARPRKGSCHWDDFVTILRRSPAKHAEWMKKQLQVGAMANQSSVPVKNRASAGTKLRKTKITLD